jgi:hypothetical protein
VIGTGNKTNDANIGNGDVPDVRLEAPGSAANPDTQYWHIVSEPNGGKTLQNAVDDGSQDWELVQ